MSNSRLPQPQPNKTIDSEVDEIFKLGVEAHDHLRGAETASDVRYGDQLVKEAKAALTDLITEKENRAYEKGKDDGIWEKIEISHDAINRAARLDELNRFPFDHAYPDQKYIDYKKRRRDEIQATLKSKGRDK